jgi:hypothetical protein
MLKPYKVCKGKKFKREKVVNKLLKPISCKKRSTISDYLLTEKNKHRFITQLFRWFRKDERHYKLNYYLKKKKYISNLDVIYLSVKIQKAGWKKLLWKLNYRLKDYKELKRRSYSLNFKFFFINVENKDKKNKEITIDIESFPYDKFNIFITLNNHYFDEFYNIINILNIKRRKKKDDNDNMLDELKYIFSWNSLDKPIAYDVYIPWYVTKENYYINWHYKRRNERRYSVMIKEKRLSSIFPLKKVIGHLVVTNKKEKKDDTKYYCAEISKEGFKRKDDLFEELKFLISLINKRYKINSVLLYFFIKIV